MNPKNLLDFHAIDPKKSLGQNFLHDPNALEKILTVADVQPSDTVLEIGPGTGQLTEVLAKAAKRLICVEIDQRMQPILEAQFGAMPHVEFVWGDFLTFDPVALAGEDYVVVANVPYYITSAILRHLLEQPIRPRRLVMTVQLEVAERVCAKPNDMSLLAVSVQYYGKPTFAGKLNAAAFWPRPDVDSAVLRIDTYPTPPLEVPSDAAFFKMVKAGFSQKRKQLKNSIAATLRWDSAQITELGRLSGVELTRRAETLTLKEWAALTRAAESVNPTGG
jgi:16S rRNA (adenine1518-N6/adenine1519-N6)-dimethyltransferase